MKGIFLVKGQMCVIFYVRQKQKTEQNHYLHFLLGKCNSSEKNHVLTKL